MTVKDYIKLSLIAAGYVKNIKIDIERYGNDFGYSVYGETWDYKEEEDGLIEIDEQCDENDGVISIQYDFSLLSLLSEISEKKQKEIKYKYCLDALTNKALLDDNIREETLKKAEETAKINKEHTEKMKPVWDYLNKINPCVKAPNCEGDFDDSDTCNGFWKCTHQYHRNCKVRFDTYDKLSSSLIAAYRKYAYGEDMTEEEANILKEHELI